ncbi:MAG: nucleotidyltransferase domain-containing protein [Armatimonadota bacterium]
MEQSTAAILSELRKGLAHVYGRQLKDVILFGSYARGEQREGSDLDVAMILSDFERPWPEIQRTGHLVSELSLRHGITISLIPVRERALRARGSPLARHIAREGTAAQ